MLACTCNALWDGSAYWNDRYGTEPDFESYTAGEEEERVIKKQHLHTVVVASLQSDPIGSWSFVIVKC